MLSATFLCIYPHCLREAVAPCEACGEWYCDLHAWHPDHEHLPPDPGR
jgi:hypothetical protein